MRIVRATIAASLVAACALSVAMDFAHRQVHDFTQEWSRTGPSGWLRNLHQHPDTVFYVDHAAEDWVRESDLAGLMAETESRQPAAAVCYFASAHAVPADFHSTVGREAAILVDAFRRKRNYPGSCSDLSVVDIADLKQWWSGRNGSAAAD